MKTIKFKYHNLESWGYYIEEGSEIISSLKTDAQLNTFQDVIQDLDSLLDHKGQIIKDSNARKISYDQVELLAPVKATKNILCIGKNYHDHILEFDGNANDIARAKETPIFFSKALSSVVGPFQEVLLHENICAEVDYEAELAIVIGKEGINIQRQDVDEYIYGYTVLNDVTSRDLQSKHLQWHKGKSLDTHCPIGPWIITKDEIENPQDLKIQSYINGELRQDSNTGLMMHDIKALVVQLSAGMTLYPGDVIATGTPKGVGKGFNPPRYLKSGDEMVITIEKIGSLKNTIV